MRLSACLAAMLLTAAPASAESLVATLSDGEVEITSSFTGERIVVFGAVRGAQPDAAPYEIAVVVQGPDQDVVVRRKESFLGIWANRAAQEFDAVPSYYVLHLSENFGAAADAADLGQYRLGVASLPFVQEAGPSNTAASFARALVDLKVSQGFYVERENLVEMLAPDVFRTTFFLPSAIPTGEYRVSVYLFSGGTFLAGQTQTLRIEKGGFSERIARFADEEAMWYGLSCVALAVFTGWFAGVIFRRP